MPVSLCDDVRDRDAQFKSPQPGGGAVACAEVGSCNCAFSLMSEASDRSLSVL
jgi:hypothetical protein